MATSSGSKPKEEKLKEINEQYGRWRTRLDHPDRKIRAEAELRIEELTKARLRIEAEGSEDDHDGSHLDALVVGVPIGPKGPSPSAAGAESG